MKQIFRKFRDRGFGLPGTRNFPEIGNFGSRVGQSGLLAGVQKFPENFGAGALRGVTHRIGLV